MTLNNWNLKFYQNRLAKIDKNFFSLCNLDNKLEKEFLVTLFGLHIELSIIPVSASETTIALAKFKWWEEEINKIFINIPVNNPLIILLKKLVERNQLDQFFLNNLLESRERDYDPKKFLNFIEIENYLDQIYYVIFAQFFKIFKYNITIEEERLVKKILYGIKANNIFNSLNIKSYNNHPFIPLDLITKLQKTPSFLRDHKAKKIISNYSKENFLAKKGLKKTNIYSSCQLVKKLSKI